jgi:hypothetical protein
LPIFRSTRVCDTDCGIMHSVCGRSAVWKRSHSAARPPAGQILYWVPYTTICNAQSNVPEDGQNNCPKHVELIGIINKQLLLHLVGCLLYYQYQWCKFKQILNGKYDVPFWSPVFRWKGNSKESNGSVNWVKLAHYRFQWQALVKKERIFRTGKQRWEL